MMMPLIAFWSNQLLGSGQLLDQTRLPITDSEGNPIETYSSNLELVPIVDWLLEPIATYSDNNLLEARE